MRFISIFTHEPSNREQPQAELESIGRLVEEGMKAGWLLATEGVNFGSKGLRLHKARGAGITITDGPFAEAREVLGGYALMKADSRQEVIALTRRFLDTVGQGTCELYELYEMPAQ